MSGYLLVIDDSDLNNIAFSKWLSVVFPELSVKLSTSLAQAKRNTNPTAVISDFDLGDSSVLDVVTWLGSVDNLLCVSGIYRPELEDTGVRFAYKGDFNLIELWLQEKFY